MSMAERRTCPRCDHDGGLDGQGAFNREIETRRVEDDKINRRIERWYQVRCPHCELVFATRERVKKQVVGEDGVEV